MNCVYRLPPLMAAAEVAWASEMVTSCLKYERSDMLCLQNYKAYISLVAGRLCDWSYTNRLKLQLACEALPSAATW